MRKRVEQGLPNQALTLFAPVGMAEDLTKVQLILCKEIKTELKAVKESIAAIPFDDVQRKVTEATTMLEERMISLEDQYNELKELIIHRTTLNLITDPTLLDHWNPADMVMKHSPWTNMRLVLNKVASENITDLFPDRLAPKANHFQCSRKAVQSINRSDDRDVPTVWTPD